jgi:hypothetical protein
MWPAAALFPRVHNMLRCGSTSHSITLNGLRAARVACTMRVSGESAVSCTRDARAVAALMPAPTTSVRRPANLCRCSPSTSGSMLHISAHDRRWRSPSAGTPPGPHQLACSLLRRSVSGTGARRG